MHRLRQLLSEILEIDKDSINEDTSPDNVESWDSFNGLLIATRLEEIFEVKFTMEEVTSVRKTGDIMNILKVHGVELR